MSSQDIVDSDSHDPRTQVQSGEGVAASLDLSIPQRVQQHAAAPKLPGYVLFKLLGEGAYGQVWRSWQLRTRKEVAVKLFLQRSGLDWLFLQREVGRVALLDKHPNVVTLLDSCLEHDPPFYAMELITGGSLAAYARSDRVVSEKQATDWMRQIAESLAYIHAKGLIHCDLKPGNVLVDEEGRLRVCDFGQSRIFTEASASLGTLFFMAPEQSLPAGGRVRAAPDVRWDIYALGATAYAVLFGHPPRANPESICKLEQVNNLADRLERYRAIAERVPVSNPKRRNGQSINYELFAIIQKCLEPDPARRYRTVQGVLNDLVALGEARPVSALASSAGYRTRKLVQRYPLQVVLSAAILFGLIAFGVLTRAQSLRLEKERDKAERIGTFLSDILKGAGPSVALGRDTAMLREMLDGATQRIKNGELTDSPEAELKLRRTVGETYLELGDYQRARELFEPSVPLAQKLFGEVHAQVASSLSDLATVLARQGDYPEAERLFRESLAMRRTLIGDEHLDVAESLNNLAFTLECRGDYTEAERHYREALAMFRKLLGEEHRDVATSLDNLAGVLESQGDYSEAQRLYREALAMRRKLMGNEHPQVATSLNNLAFVLGREGDFAEAGRLYREALIMRRQFLGDEHPNVATSLNNLAFVLESQGDYSEAQRLYREALTMRRKLLGEEHPEVAASLNNVAGVLEAQGNYPEAENHYREALAMRRKLLGEEHPEVAASLNNLAGVLESRGSYSEAERLFREALAMRRRTLGEEHPKVAASLSDLAGTLEIRGAYAEADQLHREALALRRKLLGEVHPDVARSLSNLASVLERRGEYAQAEELVRAALRICEKKLASTDPQRFLSESTLGAILVGRGKPAEAEPLLLEAYQSLKDRADVRPFRRRTLLERIVKLYDSWDTAAPSQGYTEKAAQWRVKLEEPPK